MPPPAASTATMGRNAYVSAGIWPTVARTAACAYVGAMSETPAFLDGERPPVPDIVVPRGVTSFHLPRRPVRGRLVRLGPLAQALLTRHPNHPAVTRLAGQSLALGGGTVHGAEIPRLVQCAGEGRRRRADAARRLHRHRRAARLCPFRSEEAGGTAAQGPISGGGPVCSAVAISPSPLTRGRTRTATRVS